MKDSTSKTQAVALALVVVALACAPAQAQRPPRAVFEGVVVDSISGEPMPGVLIRMDAGPEAFSGARGEFRITGLPEGRRLFALLSADCRITWGQIDVLERIPRRVRLRLPPAFGAVAEEQLREEEARQRTGGKRLEAEEIDRMNARSVTELIRRLAPQMVGGLSGEVGAASAISSGRNRSFLGGDAPVVVIDGLRIPDPDIVLAEMRPSEVQLLEVLPGAAAGWEFGSAGAGGVIKITLRSGLATGAPARRRATECVVPGFPRR